MFKITTTSTRFALTEQGKEKAESGLTGGEVKRIFDGLDESGASTSKELAEDTGMRSQRIVQALKHLEKQGYVRRLSKDDFED